MDTKVFNSKIIGIAIIIAGLLISATLFYFNYQEKGATDQGILSSEEAGKKALDFIKNDILGGEVNASLEEIYKENGLYKMKLNIEGQEVEAYLTLDGKFLFPQETAIDLDPPVAKEIPKTDVPSVNLFVMAFCPYGNEAEEIIMPIEELLGDKANIELHYIFSKSEVGEYTSLHGEQEFNQGIRELCVNKYEKDKFWDFIKQINENCTYENVDSKWEAIATNIDIDVQKIKDCVENELEDLLAYEFGLSQTEYLVQDPKNHDNKEKITISGSPTLVINNMVYDKGRSVQEYKDAICSAFITSPEECNQELSSSYESKGSATCE
jgi:hypothetical protein